MTPPHTASELLLLVAGLVVVTLVARNLFLVLPPRWQPRGWAAQALQVAPLAALLAITVPEIVRDVEAASPSTWADPRLAGALALAVAIRLGARALTALVVGAAVFLAGAGWAGGG